MSESEKPVESDPEFDAAVAAMWRRIRELQRRRARRRFVAFLLIVGYGVILASIDLRDWRHATLGLWSFAVMLGGLLYVLIVGLIGEDDSEADDDERLQRIDGVDYGE